jgi:hypothetical protein
MGAATMVKDSRRSLWRSRWAAIGAAVAVSLGAGGLFVADAASSPASAVVTIDPVRILDTRTNVGLSGPFVSLTSRKLQVAGAVVPAGATGVLLNVTVVAPSANGFLSVRPGDATGTPSTSSLNFTAGDIVPNAVQVGLPTSGANAGQIDITYDAFGVPGPTTNVLIDAVGYMIEGGGGGVVAPHDHDDRYYTKAQVDSKFGGTGQTNVSGAGFGGSNTVAFADGCMRSTTVDQVLVADVSLPLGATITSIAGHIFDTDADAAGRVRLFRVAGNGLTQLAEVSSTGTGLARYTTNLATPERVDPTDYFYFEYLGGKVSTSQRICGATATYTVPSGGGAG